MASRLGAILLVLVAGLPRLAGQSAGVARADLRVLVQDAGGSPLVHAHLTARNEATGQSFTTEGRDGEASLRLLPPGLYTLEVAAPGCASLAIPHVELHLAATTGLRLRLVPEAGASVTVTAAGSALDANQHGLGEVFSQADIAALPIQRRTFLDFTVLAPGVARANAPENEGAAANSGLSFFGGNPRQNNVMVDGLDNNDLSVGSARSTFSQEVVQEFRVVGAGFSAEYGRATGGTVNILTRGGTNTPEATLFFFLRPADLAAAPAEGGGSHLEQQQWGGSFGFPILKDRLFCFVGAERLRREDEQVVAIPETYRRADGSTVDIPQAIRAQGFSLDQGPQPLEETGTFAFLRLDWLAGGSQLVTLRANHARESNEGQLPWGGETARAGGGVRKLQDTSVALSHQVSFTPDLVNEARLMWSLRNHDLESLDHGGTPMVLILGTATFGTNRYLPQTRTESTWQLTESLTWSTGAHTLKGGLDLLRTQVHGRLPLHYDGFYRFQALGPSIPDGMAAFLAPNPFGGTGLPAVYTQGFGDPSVAGTLGTHAAFIQEEWRPRNDLTLRLGLRLDREEIPHFKDTAYYDMLRAPVYTSAGVNVGPTRIEPDRQAYGFDALLTPNQDWSSSRLSPRFSFTWQAAERLQVDGGWGRFTGRVVAATWATAAVFNGERSIYLVRTAADPPSQSPFAAWAQPGHRYTSLPAGLPSLIIPGDVAQPETRQAHLGTEFHATAELSLTLGLHHVRGSGFAYLRDVNALVPNPYYNTDPATSPNPAYRRPDLRFSSVFRYSGDGESRYWGQTLGLVWTRPAFHLRAAYTHARAEDDYTDITTDLQLQNSFDPGADWGPSWHDQRHHFTVSGEGRTGDSRGVWLKDWSLAFIWTCGSGRPYSRLAGADLNHNGDGVSDRVDLGPRDTETSPAIQSLDLRLTRRLNLGKTQLDLMAEVFNAFNRTNVTKVQPYVNGQSPFGSPISFEPRRQVQIGTRLSF